MSPLRLSASLSWKEPAVDYRYVTNTGVLHRYFRRSLLRNTGMSSLRHYASLSWKEPAVDYRYVTH